MFHDFGIVHSFISFRNTRHIFQLQSILPLKSLEHILSNHPFREISTQKYTPRRPRTQITHESAFHIDRRYNLNVAL